MKIAVTGARGGVGRYIVSELLEKGYEVRAVTRRVWENAPEAVEQMSGVDLTDFDRTMEALDGVDGVIHAGNLPGPRDDNTPLTFHNNMDANYNVLLACGLKGIDRVVITSSVCAMGHVWSHRFPGFDVFPVTEEDPVHPDDSYGISKKFTEELGVYMTQRFPSMHAAFLRISYVFSPENLPEYVKPEHREKLKEWMFSEDSWKWNMATYIDARDCAKAHVAALEKTPVGGQVYYICAPDSRSCIPTMEYLKAHWPNVPLRRPMGRYEAIESSEKAQRMLGWHAEHLIYDELAKLARETGEELELPEGRLST